MPFLGKYTLFMILGLICQLAWGKADIDVRSDTLDYLKDLRSQNVKRLHEIDQSIRNQDAQGLELNTEAPHSLESAKQEYLLRQKFLDRLILQVDKNFRDGDLRAFLERSLVEMAKVEVSSQTQSGLGKFLKYASDAVRRLPEQKENILAFLEGYMNLSVSNPMQPEDYVSTRNYTNGAKSESGQPLSREDVGAIVERRIQKAPIRPVEKR
jgi:hypothetical protein